MGERGHLEGVRGKGREEVSAGMIGKEVGMLGIGEGGK